MPGIFSEWQGRYAAAGVATFPVREKRPAVKGYLRVGLVASGQFALKFPDHDQFGFACRPNKITVLDVDAPDERLLCDALSEFGPTPLIVRSGSGNFQAWYRHEGERRRVRPDPTRPIDILGDGFVVAPPSKGSKRAYELISGSLDDLPALPPMRAHAVPPAARMPAPASDVDLIPAGRRNDSLWRQCMAKARSCRTINDLMEVAVQFNRANVYEPLPDSEVLRVVASAWAKQMAGENWFGTGERIVIAHNEVDGLLNRDPDAFILLTVLRRNHWGREFVVANAMAETMPGGGWRRERFAAARKRLETAGEIVRLSDASRWQGPARYRLKGARK